MPTSTDRMFRTLRTALTVRTALTHRTIQVVLIEWSSYLVFGCHRFCDIHFYVSLHYNLNKHLIRRDTSFFKVAWLVHFNGKVVSVYCKHMRICFNNCSNLYACLGILIYLHQTEKYSQKNLFSFIWEQSYIISCSFTTNFSKKFILVFTFFHIWV